MAVPPVTNAAEPNEAPDPDGPAFQRVTATVSTGPNRATSRGAARADVVRGMSVQDGAPLDGVVHLAQSVRDILTTLIGSRVRRRDYGSRIFALIDQPFGEALRRAIAAATAEALQRWEPRFWLEAAADAVSADHVRPLTDTVNAKAGKVLPYTVEATLTVASGPDRETVLPAGRDRGLLEPTHLGPQLR